MKNFQFDGKARDFFFVAIVAFIITLFTFGFAYPWALVMVQKWKTRHTLVEDRRLKFNGEGSALFGKFIFWWILCILTFGIYSIALVPRMTKWVTENTDFAE